MATRIVLATRNQHKVVEMQRLLVESDVVFDVVGLDQYPLMPEVPETADSFEGNALLKARAVAEHTGCLAMADDSGLCVDALNGMPGVLSARWSGAGATDVLNLQLVLDQVADVPDHRRGARFVCAVAIVVPDAGEYVVHGEVVGTLLRSPLGDNGFGYDPIFRPNGFEITTAQMAAHEKDAISHRGQAVRQAVSILQTL